MASPKDVILNPGDFCFADETTRMHTLLGSCVSITLWHPRLRVGGMCHYMLPRRPGRAGKPGRYAPPGTDGAQELDGRYADDAIQMFLRELRRCGTRPEEYQVKMFGGGNQFPGAPAGGSRDIAQDNVCTGLRLLDKHGFTLTTGQVGGIGACRLRFDLATGDVWLNCLDRSVAREAVPNRPAGTPCRGWVFSSAACCGSPV